MKMNILIFGLLSLALITSSCDPGIEYKPKNWQQKDEQHFINNYEVFDLAISRIGGLIGSEILLPEGEIYNRGKSANKFKIERAILKANGKEYVGEQNFLYNNEIKAIKSNESQHFSLYFKLEKSISEVLKEPVELNLLVVIGDQSKEVTIPLVPQN